MTEYTFACILLKASMRAVRARACASSEVSREATGGQESQSGHDAGQEPCTRASAALRCAAWRRRR